MQIIGKYGKEDLAILYVGKIDGKVVEFVESVEPGISREKKWVLIISTMFGCPVKCLICDAGEYYQGKISAQGMLDQIDFMISSRFPDRKIPINKFKVQFARMGEPSFNKSVLEVLKDLPKIYEASGLMPCISTIAPQGTDDFFKELTKIKDNFYSNGHFQLQFSIHSTDKKKRDKLTPINKWDFQKISDFGDKWYRKGDRKIALNFAAEQTYIVDPQIIEKYFDPQKYFIKITPINPTSNAISNDLKSAITKDFNGCEFLEHSLKKKGYQTLISIGEWEENSIGSNCGQFASKYQNAKLQIKQGYQTKAYVLN